MSEHKPKTEVWIVRDTGSLTTIEREEWSLVTDEQVFHYGDCTVCRNRLDALRILRSELEDLLDEVSSRLAQVIGEIESAGAKREEG